MINHYAVNSSMPDCPGLFSELASFWNILQSLAFLLILVVSLVGNFVVLKTILFDQEMRNAYCNIFIINLSLCDIIQATINLPPMAAILIFDQRWFLTSEYFPDLPCKIGKSMNKLIPAVTSLTNVIIAIDRLIGIVRPFRWKMPRHYAALLIVIAWIFSGVFGIMDFMHSQVVTVPLADRNCLVTYCYSDAAPDLLTRDIIIYCIAIFLVPLTVISIAYGRTAYELWFKAVRGLGESISQRQIVMKRKAVKMMVMVVLVFALTRIPLFVVYLVAIALGAALPFQKILTLSVSWVYCTSTVFNPLIYAAMNEKFRDQFKSTILCRNPERARTSRPFVRNAPNQSSQLLRANFTRTCTSNLENGMTDNGLTFTRGGSTRVQNPIVKKPSQNVPTAVPAGGDAAGERKCVEFLEQRYPSVDCDDVTCQGEAYEMQNVFTNNLNSCS